MLRLLFTFGTWLLGDLARKLLLGAGVAIVSSAVINSVISGFINKAISASSSIDPTYLGLLAISGVDKGISIIIGALIARATIVASMVSLKKAI